MATTPEPQAPLRRGASAAAPADDRGDAPPAVFQLTALSPLARSYKGPKYGPDMVLPPHGSVRVGRKVPPGQGYCLPPGWVQVSSNHCTLTWDAQEQCYLVTDSSTNGTYINLERVPRGESRRIRDGDTLRLSFAVDQDPSKLLEYRFEVRHEPSTPDAEKHVEAPAHGVPRKEPLASVGNNMPASGQPTAKRKRTSSPDHFQAADALAQLQKVNQELQRKVEASREQIKAVEERSAREVAELQEQLAAARRHAEEAADAERQKAESHAEAATASYKQALEAMKASMAALEKQLAEETAKAEENQASAEASAAKQAEAEAALAKLAQERLEMEATLQAKLAKLVDAEAALKEEAREMKAKAGAAAAQLSDLQHQLDMEKASTAHAEHLRKEAAEALEQAKQARQQEEQARRAAEEAQAKLKQELDEAIRQNERAEEGRDQALGASAVQQAYLQQVLSIASSLNAARHVEEAARAKAEAARDEADKSLLTLQRQVVTALNPDMDEARVEQYMKQMQSSYEAEEATQRSKSVGYMATLPEQEALSENENAFDPDATQLEVTPSKLLLLKEHGAPGGGDTASVATGSTAHEGAQDEDAASEPAPPAAQRDSQADHHAGAAAGLVEQKDAGDDGPEAELVEQEHQEPDAVQAGPAAGESLGGTEAAGKEGAGGEQSPTPRRSLSAAPVEYLTVDESEPPQAEELALDMEDSKEAAGDGEGADKVESASMDSVEDDAEAEGSKEADGNDGVQDMEEEEGEVEEPADEDDLEDDLEDME